YSPGGSVKKNGLIVWLQRRPELVSTTKDRPVVNNKEVWMRHYQQRMPLYEKYCDCIVENNDTFKSAVDQLEKILRSLK
ncbi:MAG: hypothetical protein IJI05_00260, partial [Erysipelotrichaceae bacterium]|nr:hypothetical protein [Erysipelotrichaceae bacterium]